MATLSRLAGRGIPTPPPDQQQASHETRTELQKRGPGLSCTHRHANQVTTTASVSLSSSWCGRAVNGRASERVGGRAGGRADERANRCQRRVRQRQESRTPTSVTSWAHCALALPEAP